MTKTKEPLSEATLLTQRFGDVVVMLPVGAELPGEHQAMLRAIPGLGAIGRDDLGERLAARVMREHGVTAEAWADGLERLAREAGEARRMQRAARRAVERQRVETLNAPLKPAAPSVTAGRLRQSAAVQVRLGHTARAGDLLDKAVAAEAENDRARWAGFALPETAALATARGEDVQVSRERETAGRLNVRTRDGLKLLADSHRIGAREYQAGLNYRDAWEMAQLGGAPASGLAMGGGGGDRDAAMRRRAAAAARVTAAEKVAAAVGGGVAVQLLRLVAGEGMSLRSEIESRRPRERAIQLLAATLLGIAPAVGA